MPSHVSNDKRNDAKAMLLHGKIVREVASALGISKSTVSNIRRECDVDMRQQKGGRPAKMSKYLERKVLQGINTGTSLNAKDARRYLADNQVVISSDTVRRLLKRANLEAFLKPDVLPLTPKRKKDRLNWAKSRQNWTINDWKRLVFSDETKINRLGSDGAQWTSKAVNEELKDFQLNHLYKHGGGSINVWSCFCWKSPGYLTKIEGRMDSDLYIEILDDELIKTLDYYGYSEDTVIFQQDIDPKHTAKKTLKHLEDCGIEVIDWPAYSPDLNPIENL
ncbi:Transposable element Tcb2 transposase [Choanephora cucurbitarum]|uniref:Transposable element Tcb2 transposase n=1 Tax=Choanephora cucurbitarum TaxID=101091 RepID=A0A1C7MW44_9FUNG|nr:Transposable element Tcb2 transposase [Choanephora cucurbitarum]